MMPAPIVLLAYNRPAHVRRCLESLLTSPLAASTALHVFIDGARDPRNRAPQAEIEATVQSFAGRFGSIDTIRRPRNLGLAGNVVDGVSQVMTLAGRAIVVEDDLVAAPGFLSYMNAALDHYAPNQQVGSIHGYCYPGMPTAPPYFFMPGGDCWGWASWADRWQLFDADGRSLLRRLLRGGRIRTFTLGGSAPYLRMLCQQILGRNDSWAVRWHASLFLADRLTLYPSTTFVQNIGLDGSGTHCDVSDEFDSTLNRTTMVNAGDFPPPAPSVEGYRHFRAFFSGGRSGLKGVAYRLVSRLVDAGWVLRSLAGRRT